MKRYLHINSLFFCLKKTVFVVVSLLLCSVCSLSAADNPSPANSRAAWIRSMNEQVRAKARSDAYTRAVVLMMLCVVHFTSKKRPLKQREEEMKVPLGIILCWLTKASK